MAGQPQEPIWQPAGQDQTRASWQQQPPTYAPPAGNPLDSTYAYPQGGVGQPGQGGYPPPTYTGQGQPGQGAPQWQAFPGQAPGQAAGQPRGAARAPGEKGFVGSLFDFSFTSMVTPRVIKALYVLFTIWTALWAIIFIRYGFIIGHVAGGLFVLFIVVPVFLLLTLGVYRVVLEAFMVLHRIHDDLKTIRANGEQQQG